MRDWHPVMWLLLPLSGRGEHQLPEWTAWHGRLMVLGWGISIPLGILVARYWKITPRQRWPEQLDNKFWWRWHLRLQYGGMASALVALTIAWSGVPGSSRGLGQIHAWLGWSVMALGIAQILSALLRGSKGGPTGEGQAIGDLSGDHYDMTWRRVWFERWHKLAGLAAAFLSFLSIATGLVIADGPRWMALVLLGWWVLLVGAAAWLQSRGRCIDTYQAIWGPDSALPGNKRAVIGIFVRRL